MCSTLPKETKLKESDYVNIPLNLLALGQDTLSLFNLILTVIISYDNNIL